MQPQIADRVQERHLRKVAVRHDVIGEPPAQGRDPPRQHTQRRRVLTIARPVQLHIARQGQRAAHNAQQHYVMPVPKKRQRCFV